MNKNLFLYGMYRVILILCLSWIPFPTMAAYDPVHDDTDLFLANPNVTSNRPNVLIILDNTANWNQAFTNEKSALISVVSNLSEVFNVGLMMFPETGNGNDSVDGGYVRFAIRPMDSNNKTVLTSIVSNLDKGANPGDKGNNATTALAMYEAYLYYSGAASLASFGKVKTDHASNLTHPATINNLGSYALPASPTAASLYNSPIADGCQKNFIIYISNGPANENANALRDSEDKLAELTNTAIPAVIPITPNGQQGNWADEWAKYMATWDVHSGSSGTQMVYTYTVEVDPITTGQGPDMTALLKSMAKWGKGNYYAVASEPNNGQAIIDTLNSIFKEIQAVNSVFAATTLPVSVNVRGTNLNQVYVGMFRPDATKKPRWYGNLKCYKLDYETATKDLYLSYDANPPDNKAQDNNTGFIKPGASSFWTTASPFWSFRDSSMNGEGGESDRPDGDLVEKGGAAQKLRVYHDPDLDSRNLYTCNGLCGSGDLLSTYPFKTTNNDITAADLMLNVQSVASLTGLAEQTISDLRDIKPITSLSTAGRSVNVSSFNNNGTSHTISSMNTTKTTTITAVSLSAPSSTNFNSLTQPSNGIAEATFSSPHGFADQQVVNISTTNCSNGYTGAFQIQWVSAIKFRYSMNGNATNCASATATIVTATFTANAHGFKNGQSVQISGMLSNKYDGTFPINVIDANTFTVAVDGSVSSPTRLGSVTGLTTIATATSTAHGFLVNDVITVAGASPSAYNGTFTITAKTTDTFTFDTNAASSLAAATRATTGVNITATKGSTTVTVTTSGNHGFSTGEIITIANATPSGYNGSHTITYLTSTTFSYTTTSVLAPQTATGVTASTGVSTTAVANLTAHGFDNLANVTIRGVTPDDYNGNYQITKIDNNSFSYTLTTTPLPATVTGTAHLTSPTAFATLVGHGYSTGNSILVSGATPDVYNGSFSITVLDADHFTYSLLPGTSPLQAATGTLTAAIQTTTAKATVFSHGFQNGSQVRMTGANPATLNGDFVITVTDSNHFSYDTSPHLHGAATGTILAEPLGGATNTARDDLINWVRGFDNYEDENANASFTDVRASIHGDVLHSKPAVINYHRANHGGDDDVWVFYGANDGVFHAVKGAFSSVVGDPEPGKEVWGFIPSEFFGQLKRLRNNDPIISSSNKKPYFADGPISAYVYDSNNNGQISVDEGDKVYLYFGMRRGGRMLYALDITTPDAPRFLWKKNKDDTGYEELGLTWSEPKVITKININSGKPVLIFGAGYDSNVDDISPDTITGVSGTSVTTGGLTKDRTKGRGIFVVDAATGDILWQAGPGRVGAGTHPYLTVPGMTYSIPSDITAISNNGGSVINRAYVGDTGGNIWRVNMGDANVNNWTVTRIAAIADWTVAFPKGLRKFLHAPDVVYATGYDAVLIGTGDREHPFDESVENRMYMFKDLDTGVSSSTDADIHESDMYDATSNCIQDGIACDAAIASATLAAKKGWYFKLLKGEKLVGNAVTVNKAVFFNTHQPSGAAAISSCTNNLGIARAYQVTYTNAGAVQDMNSDRNLTADDRSQIHPGGGFLPPPTPVVVQIGDKTLQGVVSGVRVDEPPGMKLDTRFRRYWYKDMD
ncbi:MAG: PilC/PilY family type IV pilus protein [Magnetococcus sp. YQC-5]